MTQTSTEMSELDRLEFDGTWDHFKEKVYLVGLESVVLQHK